MQVSGHGHARGRVSVWQVARAFLSAPQPSGVKCGSARPLRLVTTSSQRASTLASPWRRSSGLTPVGQVESAPDAELKEMAAARQRQLVSVRGPNDARATVAGGAHIIDAEYPNSRPERVSDRASFLVFRSA